MTVKELIEKLQELDPNLKVVFNDYDGADHCARFVTSVKVANRNQVHFAKEWSGRNYDKLVPSYEPKPKEQFAQLLWNE